MMVELEVPVAWWPPEDMRKDCETCYERCKLCIAANVGEKQLKILGQGCDAKLARGMLLY